MGLNQLCEKARAQMGWNHSCQLPAHGEFHSPQLNPHLAMDHNNCHSWMHWLHITVIRHCPRVTNNAIVMPQQCVSSQEIVFACLVHQSSLAVVDFSSSVGYGGNIKQALVMEWAVHHWKMIQCQCTLIIHCAHCSFPWWHPAALCKHVMTQWNTDWLLPPRKCQMSSHHFVHVTVCIVRIVLVCCKRNHLLGSPFVCWWGFCLVILPHFLDHWIPQHPHIQFVS